MSKDRPKEAQGNSGKPTEAPKMVGGSLDRFIGTWSAEEEAEFLQAVEVFEQVDESFWQ